MTWSIPVKGSTASIVNRNWASATGKPAHGMNAEVSTVAVSVWMRSVGMPPHIARMGQRGLLFWTRVDEDRIQVEAGNHHLVLVEVHDHGADVVGHLGESGDVRHLASCAAPATTSVKWTMSVILAVSQVSVGTSSHVEQPWNTSERV